MEKFCQYYLDCDGNASEAYRMAYDTSNMKPESVWCNASKLKDDAKVAQRIKEIKEERAKATEYDKERTLRLLKNMLHSNIADMFAEDPVSGKVKMRSPSQLPRGLRDCIRKMRNNKGRVDYDFISKVEIAKLIGSWNGWDAPKDVNVNHKTNKNGDILIGFDDEYDTEM